MLRLIADDFTGAADAAVAFVETHERVRIGLSEVPGGCDVLALDTATRDRGEDDAMAALRAALAEVAPGDELVLKIDSMLRGHVARSVAALLDELPDRDVVVAPAFPAGGRTTRRGVQHGVDVRALLADLPAERVVVCDAEIDADLDAIVAVRDGRPTVWVGSAGIARALARRSPRSRAARVPPRACGHLVAVVGSTCETARAQAAALGALAAPVEVPSLAGAWELDVLAAELARRGTAEDLVVTSPDGGTERLARAAAPAAARSGLLVLSGGATARAVLERCGVRCVDVLAELDPGVVVLHAEGLDGTVVTKAGSFGDAGTLVRAVEHLREAVA